MSEPISLDNYTRDLTELEKSILNRLLSVPFKGSDTLKSQLHGCLAQEADDADNYGSIYLLPQNSNRADIKERVPVEGRVNDSDGEEIQILLHIVDGFLHELEIFKSNGEPRVSQLNPNIISVHVN